MRLKRAHCCLEELSLIEMCCKLKLISMSFKHLYFSYCTERIQTMTILKKGITKCPGNPKLAIFSTGNIELCCVVSCVVRLFGRRVAGNKELVRRILF